MGWHISFLLAMMFTLMSTHPMEVTLVAQDRQRAASKVEGPSGSLTTVAERGTIYLAWRNTRGTDLPASGVYWTAAGDSVDDEEILTRLRQVPIPASAGISPELLVYFSHPELGPGASGELAFLDTRGRELECFLGTFGPNIRYASGGNPGCMSFATDVRIGPKWPDHGEVPDKGRLRLRYAAGEPEILAEFTADAPIGSKYPADVDFRQAAMLLRVGDDLEGQAVVSFYIQSEVALRFSYSLSAFDRRLRGITPTGSSLKAEESAVPSYTLTFNFSQPVAEILAFRLNRIEIHEENYDVQFLPETP